MLGGLEESWATDGRIRTTQMGMKQRENLGSAMVVGMERGLFTFPNDQLASSGRGCDLLPVEGLFLTRISPIISLNRWSSVTR